MDERNVSFSIISYIDKNDITYKILFLWNTFSFQITILETKTNIKIDI